MRNTAAHAPTARRHRRGGRGSQIMTGAPRRPTARRRRWGPGRRHPRSSRVRASRHHSSGSLRGETVAHGLDLVGEEDELLATVEVDGEELAAEVLALRDERPRRSPSNDSALEYDGAGRAAARPWKQATWLSPSFVQAAVKVVRSKRAPLKVPQSRTRPWFTMQTMVAITSASERACSATAFTRSRSVMFGAIAVPSAVE